MAVPDQPVNAGVQRNTYYGEQQQIEEQQTGAPLPRKQATPAAAATAPIPAAAPATQPPEEEATAVREAVARPQMAQVTTAAPMETAAAYSLNDQEALGAALIATPGITDVGRRLGMALYGANPPDYNVSGSPTPILPLFRRMDMRKITGEENPQVPAGEQPLSEEE